LINQYPLSPAAIEKLGRYLAGNESRHSALQALKDSFSDLEWFSDWYAKRWDKASPFSETLRRAGNTLTKTMNDITERSGALYASQMTDGIPVPKIEGAMRRALEDALEQAPEKIARNFSAGLEIDPSQLVGKYSWTMTPAIRTMATVMFNVVRLTAFLPGGKRAPRSSDVGDVFHSLYIPFVDIFRADGFVSNAISDSKLPFATTIVGNLRQLLPAIERRLALAP
jgi:hypothetical protein